MGERPDRSSAPDARCEVQVLHLEETLGVRLPTMTQGVRLRSTADRSAAAHLCVCVCVNYDLGYVCEPGVDIKLCVGVSHRCVSWFNARYGWKPSVDEGLA